ncbi:hypothetical protein AWZ03_001396 [Drosophila navojoa]|uniref:Uncharacterized protein n=1 Tax=Drosophila navojoa TaxID=7232 RepID=A0A484BW09_DRONA|nr:hypothetical protein AWZ03_001396 [Drosophila navojoa]
MANTWTTRHLLECRKAWRVAVALAVAVAVAVAVAEPKVSTGSEARWAHPVIVFATVCRVSHTASATGTTQTLATVDELDNGQSSGQTGSWLHHIQLKSTCLFATKPLMMARSVGRPDVDSDDSDDTDDNDDTDESEKRQRTATEVPDGHTA